MNDETMDRIDALVAEKIMRWKKIEDGVLWWWEIPEGDPNHEDWNGHSHTPEYTRDPAAMMEVIGNMLAIGWAPLTNWVNEQWHANMTPRDAEPDVLVLKDGVIAFEERSIKHHAYTDTMPLAVALASLKAVGAEISEQEAPGE